MQPFKLITICLIIIMSAGLAQAQMPAPLVKTAPAVKTQMAPTRVVAAYTKARYITTIKAETKGRVLEMAYVGQNMIQGEPLGLIADEEYALRLAELRGAIASQEAQVEFLKSESVRLKSLQTQNLTSATASEKNTADLKTARADLVQAKARLQQLESDIAKLTPKAPFNGFVTQQLAQPGQYLDQGQNLLEIMSSDDTEVVAQIPFKLKSVIQVGQVWQFMDQAGSVHDAEVTRFIPAATSNSRLIQVHLKDLSDQLMPGEPIKLMVPEATPQEVVAVPRDALVLRRQGAYIYTIKEGMAHKVDVTTGLAQGDMIAINGAVNAGDQVVVRGNERLRDQQAVQVLDQ